MGFASVPAPSVEVDIDRGGRELVPGSSRAVDEDGRGRDTERLQRVLGPQAEALGLNGPRDLDRAVRQLVGAIQAV